MYQSLNTTTKDLYPLYPELTFTSLECVKVNSNITINLFYICWRFFNIFAKVLNGSIAFACTGNLHEFNNVSTTSCAVIYYTYMDVYNLK